MKQSQVRLLRGEWYLPSPFAFLCFFEHLETKHLHIDFMSVFQDLNQRLSLQVACWLKSCLRILQGISVFYKY